MRKFFLLQLFLTCLTFQLQSQVKSELDYSNINLWVAHPETKDSADLVPDIVFEDKQKKARIDVFFVYPTIYNDSWSASTTNAPLNDPILNQKIANTTIKNQATIFNGIGKIYSPYYRQANLKAYDKIKKDPKATLAFELAYSDVKKAFLYYLNNWNNGRPFIIASHSQGTTHTKVLIKELIEGTPLEEQMVAAYLVGIPVNKNHFKSLPICESETQTNCYCTWRTFKYGYYPKKAVWGDSIAITNPISWTTDSNQTSYEDNPVSVLRNFEVSNYVVDAKIEQGILWTHKPLIKFAWLLNKKNWHIADFNFYWGSVRENTEKRTKAYFYNLK